MSNNLDTTIHCNTKVDYLKSLWDKATEIINNTAIGERITKTGIADKIGAQQDPPQSAQQIYPLLKLFFDDLPLGECFKETSGRFGGIERLK